MDYHLMKTDEAVFNSHVKLIELRQVLVKLIVSEMKPLSASIYQIISSMISGKLIK